jgi:hypothetical protein
MEGNPDNQLGKGPEDGERLKINTIIIPADEALLIRQEQIGASHLPDYQGIAGGLIERLTLENPSSEMYFNEEGKINELPMNRRATILLWMHRPAFRYADYVAGDAFLLGPVDNEGNDTNVPQEFVKTLFEAKRFRPEVQKQGEEGWHGNALRFDDWFEACSYVLLLGNRWTQVTDVRVVPEA